jgi:hypothetical protein
MVNGRADENHVVPIARWNICHRPGRVQARIVMMASDVDRARTVCAIRVNFVRPEHEMHVVFGNAVHEAVPQRQFARAVAEWIVSLVADEDRFRYNPSSFPDGFGSKKDRLLDPDNVRSCGSYTLGKGFVERLQCRRGKRIGPDASRQTLKTASGFECLEVESMHATASLAQRFESLSTGQPERREVPAEQYGREL